MSRNSPMDLRSRMANFEKEREDERSLCGKYAPKAGTCRVCGKKVVGDVAFPYSGVFGGPPLKAYVESWHCEGCGLVYKFPPKKKRGP